MAVLKFLACRLTPIRIRCGRRPCPTRLYKEEVIEARAMSPAEKVLAGQQLFEAACRITLAGIRNQNPGVSEQECLEILRQRLALQRRLDETS